MALTSPRNIKSAHRVLEILEYFDRDRRSATVMDMSRSLNYPQSSTSELLRCLTRLGYLHYNRARRTYSPTARVALLGAWVRPSLFRGGPVLSAIDTVARLTNETVVLATNTNYLTQFLHVIPGNNPRAIDLHGGETYSILHSPQGRLQLSTYRNELVRSAVHRLNAEETDPERQVRLGDFLADCMTLRERGWLIEPECDGVGSVSVSLPVLRHMDRLVMSVVAEPGVVLDRGEEILQLLLEQRDEIGRLCMNEDEREEQRSNVVPMRDQPQIASYHRHFA